MKRKSKKHLPYFWVLEAIQNTQTCPLCDLEHESVQRYLDGLLYEAVNDSGVRADLVRSKGYCHRHAYLLLSLEKASGTAILYQDQVNLFLQFLDKMVGIASKRSRRKPSAQWGNRDLCPACRLQVQARERAVSILLQGLSDDEMHGAFERCPGLCVPHFLTVLESAKTPEQRQYLIEIEREKMQVLLDDIEEFCRKRDYRFSDEAYGSERDVWKRAVSMMVGRAGVF